MPRQKMRLHRRELRRLMSRAVGKAGRGWEICGLLIDNGYFLQMRETRNLSRKQGSFVLDFREINMIRRSSERLGLKVAGTFHSHISWFAKPGEADIQGADDGALMLVMDTMDKDVKLWRIRNNRACAVTFELIG